MCNSLIDSCYLNMVPASKLSLILLTAATPSPVYLFSEAEKREVDEIHKDIISHRLKQDLVSIT